MLMKVFNKGQIVLPVALRRELGIEVGILRKRVYIYIRRCRVVWCASWPGHCSSMLLGKSFQQNRILIMP